MWSAITNINIDMHREIIFNYLLYYILKRNFEFIIKIGSLINLLLISY